MKKEYADVFENARKFIYRNARPIELACWRYHFENGTQEEVLTALSYYQNDDGGFGHGLEADCWNPYSSPIQTWQATEILRGIGFTDGGHAVIQGILRYLDSGSDFSQEHDQWRNVILTNNDHPHACWWEYGKDGGEFKYNPTACLAGFIIRFADKNSGLYKKACKIAEQACGWLLSNLPMDDSHVISCFIRLYEYCSEAGKTDLFDMEKLISILKEQVSLNICKDTEKWGKEYVTLPSRFISSSDSIFFEDNKEAAAAECEFIINSQLSDGSYSVPWQWWTEYREYETAANWWKSVMIINNMLFLTKTSVLAQTAQFA